MKLSIENYLPQGELRNVVREIWKNDARSFNKIAVDAIQRQYPGKLKGEYNISCVRQDGKYSFRSSSFAGVKRVEKNPKNDDKLSRIDNWIFIHTDDLEIVIIDRKTAEFICVNEGRRFVSRKNFQTNYK